MPFQKGRSKTGGRKRGQPNKLRAEARTRLEELGCDPIEGMVQLAMDKKNSPELRGRMFAELSQYAYPKRKSVEISGTVLDLNVHVSAAEILRAKLEQLAGRAPSIAAPEPAGGNIPGAD